MIARRFTARATQTNASAYAAFFRDVLTPQLQRIPGYLGAMMFNRPNEGMMEITVLTFWDSRESISRFSGETPNKAVVEPEAQALFVSFDDEVTHHDVVLDTLKQ